MNAINAILRFLGRLFRDIWLEIWKPIRRIVIRWGALALAVVLILLLKEVYPATFVMLVTFTVAILIMWFGLKLVLYPFRRKGRSR